MHIENKGTESIKYTTAKTEVIDTHSVPSSSDSELAPSDPKLS